MESITVSRAIDAPPAAVREAATKGLDVLLLAVTTELSAHTDRLRENNIGYEVLDPTEE